MQQSLTTTPDVLPSPPPSSSAVTDVRNATTNHQNSHGNTSGSNNNGRTHTLLVGGGESCLKGTGLLPKSSSFSSPPKTQDLSNVNLQNPAPNIGNSNPTQPQTQPQQSPQQQQKQQQTHCSPSKTHQTHKRTSGDSPNHSGSGSGAGDRFLQWGHRKRSKRTMGDKFSGGHTMAPSAAAGGSSRAGGGGGAKLRPNSNGAFCSKEASSSLPSSRHRNLEDSMGGGGSPSSKNHNGGSRSISRSAVGKRSHSATEKTDTKKNPSSSFGGSIRKDKSTDSLVLSEQPNGSHTHHLTSPPVVVAVAAPATAPAPAAETETHSKSNSESMEWPRIYIALSRKEKEEDFLTMKGTKLPHRPKKRAKAIDRTLQYCFPGMWLSDLTKARYEVRERKGVKKPKRRGLKGLESMDSDSD